MKLPFGKVALLAGAAALFIPAAASAQDIRNLDNARSDVLIFEGELGTAPVTYRYTIPARTVLQIDARPADESELDPVLTVTDVRSGDVLAEDDDSGGNLAARARIVSERGQQVEITVSSFAFLTGEETAGAFELQLRPRPWTPPRTRAVTLGSDTKGTLNASGTEMFTITGTKGQVLEVALIAGDEDLDPMLTLYKGVGSDGEMLTSDDDGGNSLNSLIRYTLPDDGTYTIVAAPYGDSSGAYTLRVAPRREPGAISDSTVLGFGEALAGFTAAPNYEVAEDGGDVHTGVIYSLSPAAIAAIRAGQGEVTFNLSGPQFEDPDFPSGIDPFLELGFETPMGFAAMLSDDDGAGELNSRIATDLSALAADGDWLERLRVRAYSIGGAGEFSVEMVAGKQDLVVPTYEDYAEEAAADAVEAAADTELVEPELVEPAD
jgi:hypothetical protein